MFITLEQLLLIDKKSCIFSQKTCFFVLLCLFLRPNSKTFKKKLTMRKRFEAQMTLGSTPIDKIEICKKCRDDFPKFLRAMQYIYTDAEVSEQVFSLLEGLICTKKPTGRRGMDLWTIFVLAQARLCLNTDYDRLHYLSNNDTLLRQMLGVHDGIVRGRSFDRQTIIDNVVLLNDETLIKINDEIVKAGHTLVKKKATEALRIKVDSFVTEANVHFPTDYGLLWDSGRKCIDVLRHLIKSNASYGKGWRKIEDWRKKMKNCMLTLCRATADKSKNRAKRIEGATNAYLRVACSLLSKIDEIKPLNTSDLAENQTFKELNYYKEMLFKHIDLVERRLIKGETIPHEEKIFSIFEPWVEWITKGKKHKPVEIGTLTFVATDQWGFAVDWWAADHQRDNQLLIPGIDRIREKYGLIHSCSSDKGFFSKNDVELIELFDIKAFIPKKGKRSLSDIQRESDPEFIKARRAHSAIESNINELEHKGLDRCPDKGIHGMRRYIGLAVIAYNLCRIGKILFAQDSKAKEVNAVKHKRAA